MRVQLEGNVCQDVKKMSEKLSIIRVADNSKEKDKEVTIYIDVKIFERTMKDVEYYEVKKGDRVIIEGRLVEDEFEKDGIVTKKFAVIADSVKKLWRKKVDSSF